MIAKFNNKFNLDSHFIELIKGSGITFFLKIVSILFGFFSMMFITNYYGAKEFGALSLILTIIVIFSIFSKFGMENALVRIVGELYTHHEYGEIKYVAKTVLIFSFILSMIFAFILHASSEYISAAILKKNITSSISIASIAVISTTVIVLVSSIFQGMKKIKEFIFLQFVLVQFIFFIFLFLNYLLKITDNVIIIYVISNIVVAIIALVFLSKQIFKKNIFRTVKTEHKYKLKNIVLIALPMLFAGSFAMLTNWADILMLGAFKSEEDVGIYNAAQKIASITSIFLVAINSIAAPKFVEFYSKNDLAGLKKIVQQSTKMIFYSSIPVLLLFLIVPQFFMSLLGNEFLYGTTVLVILTIGQFINAISGSVGYIMQMTDNQKIYQNIIIISAFINIVLNYLLIPDYGINGAAFASTVSMIFWNIALVFFIRKKLGFWTIFNPIRKVSNESKS